jgi:hypothetical protein
MNSIQEFENGTAERRLKYIEAALCEINLATESYISTVLIPYLAKLSLGDLNLLLQRYVLEVHFSSGETSLGSNSFSKFTIALYSKSPTTDGERPLLSISLDDISKFRFPIPTPS